MSVGLIVSSIHIGVKCVLCDVRVCGTRCALASPSIESYAQSYFVFDAIQLAPATYTRERPSSIRFSYLFVVCRLFSSIYSNERGYESQWSKKSRKVGQRLIVLGPKRAERKTILLKFKRIEFS